MADKYEVKTPDGRTVGIIERLTPARIEPTNWFVVIPAFAFAIMGAKYLGRFMGGYEPGQGILWGLVFLIAFLLIVKYARGLNVAFLILGYICAGLLAYEFSQTGVLLG